MDSWLEDNVFGELGSDFDNEPRRMSSPWELTNLCRSFTGMEWHSSSSSYYSQDRRQKKRLYEYSSNNNKIFCEVDRCEIYVYKYPSSNFKRMEGKVPNLKDHWVLLSKS